MESRIVGTNLLEEQKDCSGLSRQDLGAFFNVVDKNFVNLLAVLAFIALQVSQESYCHP